MRARVTAKDKIPPPRGWAGHARVGRESGFAREAHTGSNGKVSEAQTPDLVVFFLVTAVRAGSNLVGRTYL